MAVEKSMLDKVMTKEQRAEYVPALRKAMARKHVLARQQKRLSLEMRENDEECASLDLLTGGLMVPKYAYTSDLRRTLATTLSLNWFHAGEPDKALYTRVFADRMSRDRRYTDEDLDTYAEEVVGLLETTNYPDTTAFWLYALYGGNVDEMVEAEAPALGFVPREK